MGETEGGIFNSDQQGGDTTHGWTGGGGVEHAWDQNWSIKFEYLHVKLGDIPFGIAGGGNPRRLEGEGDFDTFRAGTNFRQ